MKLRSQVEANLNNRAVRVVGSVVLFIYLGMVALWLLKVIE